MNHTKAGKQTIKVPRVSRRQTLIAKLASKMPQKSMASKRLILIIDYGCNNEERYESDE